MICRIWRGWTTDQNADAYEAVVRGCVIPGIEAMRIPGFRHIDLLKRKTEEGFEFTTLMWFDDLESVKTFIGPDYTRSHVPDRARAVLSRYDAHAAHFDVLDRREQATEEKD